MSNQIYNEEVVITWEVHVHLGPEQVVVSRPVVVLNKALCKIIIIKKNNKQFCYINLNTLQINDFFLLNLIKKTFGYFDFDLFTENQLNIIF